MRLKLSLVSLIIDSSQTVAEEEADLGLVAALAIKHIFV